jgi:PAS domain S-box-containing protein
MVQEKALPDQPLPPRLLLRVARACALLVTAIGVLVLIGWVAGMPLLKSLNPHWVSMRVNTAVGFLLAGLGLLARTHAGGPWPSRGLGLLVFMLGLVTLSEYIFGWNAGIDLLFYHEPPGDFGVSAPGRMAPMSALNFVLAGLLLVLAPAWSRLRQGLVLGLGAVSLQVLIGYMFGSAFLYELPVHVSMALHTALGFLLFAVGYFCTMPDAALIRLLTGSKAGSIMARRMLPAIFILPLMVAWLRISGEHLGWYNSGFGVSLGLISVIGLQVLMMFWALDALNRREQAELEKHRLLTTVLDSLGEGVVAMDTSMHMNTYNRTAQNMLGLGAASDELEKWGGFYGVFHPDTMAVFEPSGFPLLHAIEGRTVTGVQQFIRNAQRPDGVYISVSSYPMRDERGTIVGAVAVFSDVSERRRAQQELDQVARYATLHSAALSVFNEGLDRARLLPAFLSLLDEHLGCHLGLFYSYDDWHGCYELEATHGAFAGLRPALQREEPWLRSSLGNALPFVARMGDVLLAGSAGADAGVLALPVQHQDSLLGLLLLDTNGTAGERAQDFLRRLCAQLGSALHNLRQYEKTRMLATQLRLRNEEIARKNHELEAASQLKSEFLANMSHELRTPLNAIIGFSEILGDGILGELPPRQKECIKDIHESGQHLLELINDILDLSKIEAGRLTLDAEMQDVGLLLRNALTIVKERAMTNQLTLAANMPESPLVLAVDARRIKQIVYNLLSNAVKFTPVGGRVELTLCRRSAADVQAQEVSYRSSDALPGMDYAGITVSDTGIGISVEEMGRLFQPFIQLDSSLNRQFTGTGLGLVIVRRLTELHGGLVTVSSLPGQGSCFGIWLPLHPVQLPESVSVEANGKPLALIVEDDSSHAEMIRLMLEDEGFQTIIARDGASAVRIAGEHASQLITLDLILPDMEGWETLLQLRALPNTRHTPVVIISIVAEENARRGLALGASGVLRKPLDRADLVQVLDTIGVGQVGKQKHRVLLVDDDPLAIDILQTFLHEIPGVEVVCACGGEEGIALAKELLPDLLVVDLMMPEVSGFEVVQALQKNPDSAVIPVIVVTAKQLSAEDRQQLQGRVRMVIEKAQFTRHGFLNEVRRAMRSRQPVEPGQ